MSFTGVKQPEFDSLVSRHSTAAQQLEGLAAALYGELTAAGLDTGPALRIRDMAKEVGAEVEDLRRRQRLIRDMERLKVTFGTHTPAGTMVPVPDSRAAAEGLLNGTLAANAAVAAGRGDTTALAQLRGFAGKASDPEFVKAFLSKLGAKGITELPASLALQMRANVMMRTAKGDQVSQQVKEGMKLLATALAKGTDPKDPAFLGEAFLSQLVKEGRAEHKANEVAYVGYQAQALIWRASDGKPPFSKRFMEVVGRDAIVHQKELSDAGPPYANAMDLATVLGLSDSMQPGGPNMGEPGKPIKASVIDDLSQAARHTPEAAQALLFHTPQGWNKSIMEYLLTDRLDGFNHTKNYAPFAGLLQTALSGKDKESLKFTNDALVILKKELDGVFAAGDDGKLTIADQKKLDRLSFLDGPMGTVMAAHIDEIFGVFDDQKPTLKNINQVEMDRVLTFVGRNEGSVKALVGAESQRMFKAIQDSYRRDNGANMRELLIPEARFMGHLLEPRRLVLMAQAKTDEQARAEMKGLINDTLSELTGPAGKLAARFGFWGDKAHEKLTPMAFDKLSAVLAERLVKEGLTKDSALQQANDDREMTLWMVRQMILSTKIAHGGWSSSALKDLEGKPFATAGHPPALKTLDEIVADPATYDGFIDWARWHTKIESKTQDIRVDMDNSAGVDVHANLGIDRNY
ncbi:hypothetical protein ACIBO2_25030 [Nonomuraea sp. NPDC050022]|uniref:hypothetical protein n=1 Tax=Nonomuraea sp. NPDC050022 TaxID=3364358 RepID=UPI0037BCF105